MGEPGSEAPGVSVNLRSAKLVHIAHRNDRALISSVSLCHSYPLNCVGTPRPDLRLGSSLLAFWPQAAAACWTTQTRPAF